MSREVLLVLAIVACVLIEGFFSGSEMALVSADRLKLRARVEEGHAGSKRVMKLLERPERLLGTCLIGTNLCVVTAATIATHLAVSLGLGNPAVVSSLALAPVVLILAEMVPKSIYQYHADLLAPLVSRPIGWAQLVFAPGLVVVGALNRLLLRISRQPENGGEQGVSRADLRLLVDSEKQGSIDEDEREMIRKVLEFSDISVREAMVPLIEIKAIPDSATVLDAARTMVATGLSRLPVYRERVDDITGVVVHRDLLFVERLDAPVSELQRRVPFVPETKGLEELFNELRRDRQRIAVVVDEYGGATGIISTEDILEEIVGEIEDEFDRDPVNIRRFGERQWSAGGRAELDQIEGATGLALPEGDYETLAGFLLAKFGRIPSVGERLQWGGWRLTVSKATDRAIQEVVITRQEPK